MSQKPCQPVEALRARLAHGHVNRQSQIAQNCCRRKQLTASHTCKAWLQSVPCCMGIASKMESTILMTHDKNHASRPMPNYHQTVVYFRWVCLAQAPSKIGAEVVQCTWTRPSGTGILRPTIKNKCNDLLHGRRVSRL